MANAIANTDSIARQTLLMRELDWSLRPARGDDYEILSELHEETMAADLARVWGWDEVERREFFDGDFHRQLAAWQVIEIDGETRGALLVREGSTIHVLVIAIDPTWQSHGIGGAIFRRVLMPRALEAQKPLTLNVFFGNDRALAFYKRLGMREDGYAGQGPSHIRMRWEGAESSKS
jgi:GNAT superfamily N-acetyltransferase